MINIVRHSLSDGFVRTLFVELFAPTVKAPPNRPSAFRIDYFLFIGGSSSHIPQYALGFMLVAFLTILIFIIVLSP